MIIALSILISQLFPLQHSEPMDDLTTLRIEISGIKNAKGHLLIALFKSADGFPDKREKALITKRIPSQIGSVLVDLPALETGSYAFAIIHDENDNLKLDTGFLGIPKEGFCFSKQAMGSFGPPSFKDASFAIAGKIVDQKVKISYW